MNFTVFCNLMKDMVQQRFAEGTEVRLQEVLKNNNVRLSGLIITEEGKNISPTIYLESFYQAFCEGTPMDVIANAIVDSYLSVPKEADIDLNFFKDFERVKGRIAYRLVNRKYNEELLADVPFIPYLDLAICFFCAYSDIMLGEGVILVRRSHMEMWNTDVKELFALAQQNTPQLYPKEILGMDVLLAELMGMEGMDRKLFKWEAEAEQGPMFVLTNEKRVQGAATILYPDLLEQIAAKVGGGFWIIPSSVHEVIIVPYHPKMDILSTKRMIFEINRTKVDPEEVLSDSLYAYNEKDKRIINL